MKNLNEIKSNGLFAMLVICNIESCKPHSTSLCIYRKKGEVLRARALPKHIYLPLFIFTPLPSMNCWSAAGANTIKSKWSFPKDEMFRFGMCVFFFAGFIFGSCFAVHAKAHTRFTDCFCVLDLCVFRKIKINLRVFVKRFFEKSKINRQQQQQQKKNGLNCDVN